MTTPPLDLPALKEIANAATPGKWAHRILLATKRGAVLSTQDDGGLIPVVSQGINPANSVHIATFDPPTALALLDRVEAAEKKVAAVRELHAKMPVYDDQCDDADCNQEHFEAMDDELYHCATVAYYACEECRKMTDGELDEYPCPTIAALDGRHERL